MRRRHKALIAIALPIIVVYGLKYTFNSSYEWLMGYMFAMALVFKGSILSLWFASKLKIIAFLQHLTLLQTLLLLLKRWFLDNVVTAWIKEHILLHLLEAFQEIKSFYLHLNLKAKLKNIGGILLSLFVVLTLAHWVGYLDNLLFFTQVKLLASAIVQGIVTYTTKFLSAWIGWFTTSWIAPLLQLFALSYLLTLLEKYFGPKNLLSRFFNFLGDRLNLLFYYLGFLKQKHIDPMVACKVVSNSKKVGNKLTHMIQNKKIREEYLYFEHFENLIMKGHIDAYYTFKGMEKIESKQKLYQRINEKTKDNIDIVAYISRNAKGELLDEGVVDTFHHDIFLLESFASHQTYGVKTYLNDPQHIDHTDFWVLNTSSLPILMGSYSENFEPVCISPHGLKLIKTDKPFCYASGDVYGEYEGVRLPVTPISY